MRILYLTSANGMGGGNIAFLHILRQMTLKGHEIMVITATNPGPLPDKLRDIACPFVQIDFRANIYPVNTNPILYIPRLCWMLYKNHIAKRHIEKVMMEYKPDIVHTNVGPVNIAANVSNKLGIPHVWHQREYIDIGLNFHIFPRHRRFLDETHRVGNYNICITQGVFDHSNFRKGIDRVIYDGVFPMSATNTTPIEEKENYVLFVGRISPIKGPLELIRVFSAFRKIYPQYKLLLAGSYKMDDYVKSCFKMVEIGQLQSSVVFLGECSEVYPLMAKAKMMVVPSQFEGFGFITAEAMLNFCPVVGRNTGGTKEQFDIGLSSTGEEIGFRFSNEDEMLKAMCSIVESDVHDMCQRAHKVVSSLYTVEQNAAEIEDYYKHILKGL